jgi:hypothetical protein
MNPVRIVERLKLIATIGVRNTIRVLYHHRIYARRANKRMQTTAAHNWTMIVAKHKCASFAQFWNSFTQRSLPIIPLANSLEREQVMGLADEFAQNRFDLLGSGAFDTLAWNKDVRLAQQDPRAHCAFDASLFYQRMRINAGKDWQLTADIKVPWELSRFYQAPVLAQAYLYTDDERYIRALLEQMKDWIGANPYRFGPNWLCAMEVSIRAVNWIYALMLIRSSRKETNHAELISCALYDHFEYIENNWEFYDSRTNNHYLANLVGYLACSWYFTPLAVSEKATWAHQELLRELEKTVFAEGSSYEGSTAYHRLVTELFWHGLLFSDALGLTIPDWAHERLERMMEFCSWTQGLNIGDDDSGRVTMYPVIKKYPVVGFKQYPKFGLAVHVDAQWHIALRQHAFAPRQPSGHFHSDAGAVVVSLKNIPILVDPGSYVYTPSINWRNYFRQASNHNSFMLLDTEPIALDERLWSLQLPRKRVAASGELRSSHRLYKKFGLIAHRAVAVQSNMITITDHWQADQALPILPPTVWNFTLAPHIEPRITEQGVELWHEKQLLARLHSESLQWTITNGWYAPSYGVKVATKQLRAQKSTKVGEAVKITLEG